MTAYFYLKAKEAFRTGKQFPVSFEAGHFYSVHSVDHKGVWINNKSTTTCLPEQNVDILFERCEGSFIDLVANRPALRLVASKLADAVVTHRRSNLDVSVTDDLVTEIETSLKWCFLNMRHPQPNTPLTGWEFSPIEHGRPRGFLYDILTKHANAKGVEQWLLENVTVGFVFTSETAFTFTRDVTIKHREECRSS